MCSFDGMTELISIIVPVYNVEKYIERCMKSLLNQTYKNIEIILIDDKSKDKSKEICLEYAKSQKVVLVEHAENKGLSGARNTGISVAKGKYIIFVDSDDYVEPNMIENLYACMKSNHADTVIGGYKKISSDKVEVKNPYYGKVYNGTESIKRYVVERMLGNNGIDYLDMSVWRVMFSGDIIREFDLKFPERIYISEDIIFDFGYYLHSNSVAMSDDVGYCYCFNSDSLTQSFRPDRFNKLKLQTKRMRELSQEANLGKEADIRIDSYFIGNSIHHIKTMLSERPKINYRKCIRIIKDICDDGDVVNVNWRDLTDCISGKDKIPYILIYKSSYKLLYYWLSVLIMIRKAIRRY